MVNRLGKNYRSYFTNTLWLISERVLRLGINLFVSVWVARYLGPERFGSLNFSLSFVGLFGAIALMGLDQVVIRDLVQQPENTPEILASAFWLKFGGTLGMWLVMAAIWPWLNTTQVETLMVLWVAGSIIFQTFYVIDYHFQALVQSRYVVWAHSAQILTGSAVKVLLIWVQADLHWFAMVYGLEHVVHACMLWMFHRHTAGGLSLHCAKTDLMRNMMKESWPLLLSGIAITLYMRMDQVMIQQMLGPHATGQYAAAVRISEAWYFIPAAICNSVFPSIIYSFKEGRLHYQKRLHQLYSLMVWHSVFVAICVTLISEWMMLSLYGADYSQSGRILMIHIWAGVFVSMGISVSKWEVNEKLTRYALYRTGSGALCNFILNLFFIPKYGGMGAAVATLISQAVSSYGALLFMKKTRKNFFLITKGICSPKFFNVS